MGEVSFYSWPIAVILGSVAGLLLRRYAQLDLAGVWALSFLVVLFSLRMGDILKGRV